jgi:hypothetical protein
VKVNINGHSHQVEIEADGDLRDVVDTARTLWNQTVQPERGPAGPAFGFSAEIRGTGQLYAMDADGPASWHDGGRRDR